MSILKIPTTDVKFKQKQDQLMTRASAVYAGMNGNALYPTPPITMAAYVIIVNAYQDSLAEARMGTVGDTAAKNLAKKNLITAMKALAGYVNEVAAGLYSTQNSQAQIANMRVAILSSGFAISKISRPIGNGPGLKLPIIKKLQSLVPGTFSLLLRNYTRQKKGIKVYSVMWRTSATTSPVALAGPWETNQYTSGNIEQDGLVSGKMYDVQIAAVGGRNTKLNQLNPLNYTPIRQLIIT